MLRTAFTLIVLASAAAAGPSPAQVVENNFQFPNTGDLAALCNSQATDKMCTAAQNFCHGFAVGTYRTLLVEQTAQAPPCSVLQLRCPRGHRRWPSS